MARGSAGQGPGRRQEVRARALEGVGWLAGQGDLDRAQAAAEEG